MSLRFVAVTLAFISGMTFHTTALAGPPIRFNPSIQNFGSGSTHTISATNVSGLSLPLQAIGFTAGPFSFAGGTCLTEGSVTTTPLVFDAGARSLAPNETCTIEVTYQGGNGAVSESMYITFRNGRGRTSWMTVQGGT